MRFLKWFGIFAVAFLVAWILIFTFNQDPLVGFLLGLWIAIYNFVTLKTKLAKTTKKMNSSEHQLSQLTMDLENCRAEMGSLQQRFDQLQEKNSEKSKKVSLDLKETNDAKQ
jgi:chromosome segregation ATPase